MRNTLLAAAAGAAVAASILMVVPPSGNAVNAQAIPLTYSKKQAQCILHHMAKASTDKAVLLLQSACMSIHTERSNVGPV
jgi:hypothetical protein